MGQYWSLSEENKSNMSKAQLERRAREKANGSFRQWGVKPGDTLSDQHKAKISSALTGKPKSEETKAAMSKAMSKAKRGSKHSPKTKAKIAEAARRREAAKRARPNE
jgi:NUMOD3 motif